MSELEASFDQRLGRAKLEALKELAYGASHEINNPLANISARAQTLLRDEHDPERRRALEAINLQALRAHEMISDLMLYARPPRLDVKRTDIVEVANSVVAELRAECQRREIDLTLTTHDSPISASVDPLQFAVAIKAVVINAIEAIGVRGRVDVQLSILNESDSVESSVKTVQISVRDTGPGISPAIRPHIFEPFFSGREAGRGLGFGLSKAWRILVEHGGNIRVDSTAVAGATFVLELPVEAANSPVV